MDGPTGYLFTVAEATAVVGQDGETVLGVLRPDVVYRAVGQDSVWVTLEGQAGQYGYALLAQTRPVDAPAARGEPPPPPPRSRLRAFAPMLVVVAVAVVAGVVMLLAGPGETGDTQVAVSDDGALPAVSAPRSPEPGPATTAVAAAQTPATSPPTTVPPAATSTTTPTDVSPHVAASISIGAEPGDIAFGFGAVWATSSAEDTVYRVDPATNQVVAAIPVGDSGRVAGHKLAVGFGAVWVANAGDDTVSRIDPTTNQVAAVVPVGLLPEAIEVGEGSVWVATNESEPNAANLERIDPSTNRVARSLTLPDSSRGRRELAVGHGSIWVALERGFDGSVLRIEPSTLEVVSVTVVPCLEDIAADAESVWVTYQCEEPGKLLWRINPLTNELDTEIRIPAAGHIAVANAVVAVAGRIGEEGLVLIDPNGVKSPLSVPIEQPRALALGADAAWVIPEEAGVVYRIEPLPNS